MNEAETPTPDQEPDEQAGQDPAAEDETLVDPADPAVEQNETEPEDD